MAEIALAGGRVALVDDEDVALVSRYRWGVVQGSARLVYARSTSAPGPPVSMHRLIAGAPGLEVDHRNGDGLDNRRANLRACSHAQNIQNQAIRTDGTSRFKGVSWYRTRGVWRAVIRNRHVGYFASEEDAARAYDAAALEAYGEYARVNFP